MKHLIESNVFVLGNNIDTDQILTAEFMKINPSTEEGYRELGKLAMCGLPTDLPSFINNESGKAIYKIIVAGDNFGCGSSREHAPIALGASGVKAVIAKSFARIFFRNCITTGELLPLEIDENLFELIETGDSIEIDIIKRELFLPKLDKVIKIKPIGELMGVVEAGGIFNYAREEEVVAINSQSRKSRILFILKDTYGFHIPKGMQEYITSRITRISETEDRVLTEEEIYNTFKNLLINKNGIHKVYDLNINMNLEGETTVKGIFESSLGRFEKEHTGEGVLEIINIIFEQIGVTYNILNYSEHGLGRGDDARAASYISIETNNQIFHGIGVDRDITRASIQAIISALNKHVE